MHPEILVPSWTPSPAPDESLLGQRLMQAGLLTQDQVSQALRSQRQTRLRFGEVCLERGWISPETLYQHIPSHTLGLGELLVMRGALAFDQLRVALAQQRRYGRKLGEILVWRGWLQPSDLEEILGIQHLAQSLQFPNAWAALHELQVFSAEPEIPEPYPSWAEGQTSPESPEAGDELFPVTVPLARGHAPTLSPAQIDALQFQLEIQAREWQAQIENLEMQWTGAEQEYQQQIAQLQEQLRWQHQESKSQQQEIIQRYRRRIRSLETQITQLQAEYQQTQELLTNTQAHIDSLQEELNCRHRGQDQHYEALHQHYQQQIQALHTRWNQEHQSRQHLESLHASLSAQIERQTLELQQLRPIAEKYRQLRAQLKPLSQRLAQDRATIQTLSDQLAHTSDSEGESEQSEQNAQIQALKAELAAAHCQIRQLQESSSPIASPNRQTLPETLSPHWSLLTPQATRLLTRLRQADLIQADQIQTVLQIWMTQGGQLTALIAEQTGLSPTTLWFFSEETEEEPGEACSSPLSDPQGTMEHDFTIRHHSVL